MAVMKRQSLHGQTIHLRFLVSRSLPARYFMRGTACEGVVSDGSCISPGLVKLMLNADALLYIPNPANRPMTASPAEQVIEAPRGLLCIAQAEHCCICRKMKQGARFHRTTTTPGGLSVVFLLILSLAGFSFFHFVDLGPAVPRQATAQAASFVQCLKIGTHTLAGTRGRLGAIFGHLSGSMTSHWRLLDAHCELSGGPLVGMRLNALS